VLSVFQFNRKEHKEVSQGAQRHCSQVARFFTNIPKGLKVSPLALMGAASFCVA